MSEADKTKINRPETALITGSRRGIGLGIALALAGEGFKIILNATAPRENAAEAIERVVALGVEVDYIQADISSRQDRRKLLDTVKERFGRLDVLVNNAGVGVKVREDILEASEESFDRLMEINLKSPYFLTQQAAKWMVEQKNEHPGRCPKIITVSSISAYTASPSRGEYCVSKAGLTMLTYLFAARLAEHGIGVYEIRPGVIETDMTAKVKDMYDQKISEGLTPIRRWGQPEDCGKAVAAIAAGYLPFSTGEIINVDGGFHLKVL